MNAELLLAHFDRISDAPDAVVHLRKFILDLAVRGKLVDQNPDDESAEKLMRRITKNRSTAIVHGSELSIRFTPSEPAPFSLPSNWIWARLGSICSKTGSGSTPRGGKSVYQQHGVAFLRSQNIYDDGLRLDDVAYIADETHEHMSGTAVEPGDLLLNITGGSIGRCCLVPQKMDQANVSQHVAIIRVALSGTQFYLHKLVLSPYFQSFVMSEQTGAGRLGLPKNKMDLIPVALPPLPEQHRIVAKVDELMALCDRLEAAQREQEARREQLTASAHHHLNNGGDAGELRAHVQFFIGYLPRLTKRPDQIKQLRQTILNLAVRGKLVHQFEGDESVATLFRNIQEEQKQLINQRVIKKRIYSDTSLSEEALIDIPEAWQFTALGKLLVFGPQNGISPTASSRPDAPRSITLTATTSGTFKSDFYKQIEANVPLDSEFWLRDGDLLFQRGNTREYVGIAAYYDGEPGVFLYPDLIIKVRLSKFMDLRYVHLCCVAPYARDYFGRHASGAQATMPKINHDILINLPIPVPPLAAQHRIVTKVDELMALCDKLEANLCTTKTETSRLLESLLHHALEASA